MDAPTDISTTDSTAPVLRAVIADDDPFARRVVKEVLQSAGIVIVSEARGGAEAVELTTYYRPDVLLMDVGMPDLDGVAATRQIVEQVPGQVVILLTGLLEDETVLDGLRAGAVGFLSKDVDLQALPRAVRGAHAGEAAISRRTSRLLIEELRRAPEGLAGMRPIRSPLTAREWEVLDLLGERLTTDEIARQLVLSTETIRSHVKNVLRKLEVNSREEAVEAARRMRSGGLV